MASLIVTENRTLTPVDVNTVLEPSVSNKGDIIFYTGNWFTAKSFDSGITWEYASLLDQMSDACCDQISYYDPKHSIFLWYLQGRENPSTGENTGLE